MTRRIELADDPDLSGWTELTEVKRETLRCGGIANKTEVGSSGGFDWYDDAGNRSLPGRRPIRVIEDATTPDTVLFYGRVSTKGLGRGINVADDAKQLGVGLDDYNKDLQGIIVDGWSRPAETDVARVNALITDCLSGAGSTSARARNSTDLANTYVASSPAIDLPAEKYVDSSPARVLQDIVAQTGKECFVTVDGELFYDAPTSTAYASTYSITDDYPNTADELLPIWEGDAATEDPTELLSGARAKYGVNAAVVSDSRGAIETAFDKWEDTVFLQTSSAARAALELDTLLDNQGTEEKSRRCTVEVPEDEVDRIKWGQTISFRAAAAGDLTPVTLRISYLLWEVPQAPGAPYLAHLELSKPKKIAPRIKKGSNPAAMSTPKAPVDPANLVGLDLGTETWADREYKTLVPHRYAPSSPFTDSDNPLIAQPTAVRGWSTTGPPWIGSGTSGTFVRHVAPAGASWARLRASVYSAGDIIDTTTVAVRLASGASFWDTGTPPQHDQIGNTVWQRTIPTDISPAVTGPFALECIIPIVNGQCQFVFIDVGDVSDPTPPDRSWISYMFAQGEAYGGPLKYELTYYGVSNVGVGDWVQPIEIAEGDGSETIFTTPYPYTPGSLAVYVEGTLQVPDETDPTTGSFTLPYAPASGQIVSVAFVVASLTQTGVPLDDPNRELGTVGGSGAPNDATYLVQTAHAGLTSEAVVGATPGGELGGTWSAPTVDATHSGSTHDAATNTHIADPTDAHDASSISIVDAGGYYATSEVEAALQEIGAGGIGGGGGSFTGEPEIPAGTIDGSNDDFTLSVTPTAGIMLFKNGLIQREGAGEDYTLATNTITYEAGNIPQTGDTHIAYLLEAPAGGGGGGTATDVQTGTGTLTPVEGEIGWETATDLLRLFDGQRDRNMSAVGWAGGAYPLVFSPTSSYTTGLTMSAAGETVIVPMVVSAHMLLERVLVRILDTTLQRSWEWRLYVQPLNNGNAGESVLIEVPGANGSEIYTATVASTRAAVAAGAPVYVGPGLYWLAVRNNDATNSFSLGTSAVATQFSPNHFMNGTVASALGSTFDTDSSVFTGQTKSSAMVAVRLDGRVFGHTVQF